MIGKILVVDDDPSMVRTLCDILRLRGWDSVGVLSGDAAIKAVHEDHYAVVLMDIVMPGIDGVAALKQIKRADQNARVVLMTAHAAEERIADAMRAGAIEVMSKPIDFGSLLQLLGSANQPRLVVGDAGPDCIH
jgi:DNA-binding NtrC family response regulator